MANAFKEFFTPKTVVGLEVTPETIGAVRIANTLKGPELSKAVLRDCRGPEDVEQTLREMFQGEDLKHEILVTCVPGSSAFVRQLTLPFAKARKLDKVVRYQMEPHVPLPIEEMVVDFLPSATGDQIVAVALPKKGLSEHLADLARAELNPEVVTVGDVGLFVLYSHLYREQERGPTVLLRFGTSEVGIQVVKEGRVAFIRVLPGQVNACEEILKTLQLYRLKAPDAVIEEVLAAGIPAEEDAVDRIGSLLEVKASYWRPFDALKQKGEAVENDIQPKLSVPLGLALSLSGGVPKALNLRREEFRVTSSLDLKRIFTVMASGLLFLLILFTFNVYQKLYIQQSRYDHLKREIQTVFHETFPKTTRLVKGQELAQMRQKIDSEAGRFRLLGDASKGGTVLSVLASLTEAASSFPDVRIDNFSVEDREVRIDGTASSFETIDKLKERLSNMKDFGAVRLAGAKTDKRDNAVRFSFGLEKRE